MPAFAQVSGPGKATDAACRSTIGQDVRVTSQTGRHAGTRRTAATTRSRLDVRATVLLWVGLTLAVVAWGYLAWLAIDFGTTARDGNRGAWWLLALASVGAMACLFVGLMLAARLRRGLAGSANAAPAPTGGRRRAS